MALIEFPAGCDDKLIPARLANPPIFEFFLEPTSAPTGLKIASD